MYDTRTSHATTAPHGREAAMDLGDRSVGTLQGARAPAQKHEVGFQHVPLLRFPASRTGPSVMNFSIVSPGFLGPSPLTSKQERS